MPELPDRFRVLDQLEVPDVDARARALGPRPPTEPDGPSPAKRTTVIVVALVVALVGVGFAVEAFRGDGSAVPTGPVPPGQEWLAFSTSGNGDRSRPPLGYSIAVVRSDGSEFHFVTQASEAAPDLTGDPWVARYRFAGDIAPAWSPDGSTIAFVRTYGEATYSLCTIRPDGTDFKILVRDFQGWLPAWSPDGSMLAYTSEREGAIRLIDADGTNDRALRERPGIPNTGWRTWAKHGGWLYVAEDGHAYLIQPDRSDYRRVFRHVFGIRTQISPDGSLIAFESHERVPLGSGGPVFLADPDGSHQRRLTPKDGVPNLVLGWSADSTRVILGRPRPDGSVEVWSIRTDGSDLQRIDLPAGVGPIDTVAATEAS